MSGVGRSADDEAGRRMKHLIIPNFEPLSPEEAQYYSDRYLLSNTIQPIGTILKGTFLVIHDLKNNTFKVSTEPIEY
jgi:hypothetical protein